MRSSCTITIVVIYSTFFKKQQQQKNSDNNNNNNKKQQQSNPVFIGLSSSGKALKGFQWYAHIVISLVFVFITRT